MKGLKKILFLVLLCLISVIGITACKNETPPDSPPTQSDSSTGNNSSSDKADDNSQDDPAHVHSYTVAVTAPTCTEQGFTAHTCSCGDSYVDTYVNALNHEFINFVSDNNATYEKDGTKTAKCEHSSCDEQKTVTDVGSMLVKSGITFKTLTVNGTSVYGKVGNTTTTFSFINEIAVSGTAKFVVSLDIYGLQQVATKMIPLEIGDNTVYITETIDDEPINVYTVTVRRRPTYNVTFNTNGGTSVVAQTVEEDSVISAPQTLREGYTFGGWDYDFSNPITKNETITASWTANNNTPYKVEYYLQNLENDEYTLETTENKTGTTDTTATAEIKTFEHFTYNESISAVSGNIDGDGSRVLRVYYVRKCYAISVNNNNAKAGTATNVNGTYRYEKEITIIATTNIGYTWLGWYDGENLVCDAKEFVFKAEKDLIYTARWKANEDTRYTVNYYLQNLDNDDYTLEEIDNLTGETDTTATVEIKEYAHFTYAASVSTISGNIDGSGNLVLSVYYTRNAYMLSLNNTTSGSITNAGTYKYGKEITTTATPFLGYDFLGWYDGEEALATDLIYTFTMEQNVTATFSVKKEMSNFYFSSTATTCSISGVKDCTVVEIIVPSYVTAIDYSDGIDSGHGAFYDCRSLTSITLPFVGASETVSGGYYGVFGIIFGYRRTTSTAEKFEGATQQWSGYAKDSGGKYQYYMYHYYIPTSLRSITITGGEISGHSDGGAFRNCSNLTSVTIK